MEPPEQDNPDLNGKRAEGPRCLEEGNYDGAHKALQEPALSEPKRRDSRSDGASPLPAPGA